MRLQVQISVYSPWWPWWIVWSPPVSWLSPWSNVSALISSYQDYSVRIIRVTACNWNQYWRSFIILKVLETVREAFVSCFWSKKYNPNLLEAALFSTNYSKHKSGIAVYILTLIDPKEATAHHLLLPLMVSGTDVVWLVCGLCAGRADAGVVGAAVNVQQAFVFLTDFVL